MENLINNDFDSGSSDNESDNDESKKPDSD